MCDAGGVCGCHSLRHLYGKIDRLPLRKLAPCAERLSLYSSVTRKFSPTS